MPNKITIRFLSDNEFHLWDSFVDECEQGTIFNKTYWLKNILSYKNIKLRILAGFDNNDKIITGFAFGYKLKFGIFKIIEPPPITPYNSILIKERNSKNRSKNESYNFKIANEFIQFLNKKFHYIKITLSPEYFDIRPFIWNNYKERVLFTYSSELVKVTSIFENFDSDIKRRIKKAQQLPYNIKTDETENNINAFYQLQKLSFNKQVHAFKLSKDQFLNFMQILFFEKKGKIYTVYLENTPVASCVLIFDKSNAYYWLAGSDPKHLNTGLNQLLFQEMLVDLSKNEIKTFDFLGANTKTIAKYKSTYNFKLAPYYSVDKTIGFIPKILFKIKEIIA